MPAHDPVERLLLAARAGNISAARKSQGEHDADMAKVRDARDEAMRQRFAAEIDPDGTLAATDPADLEQRITRLRRAHYADLARRSHVARRQRTQVGAA